MAATTIPIRAANAPSPAFEYFSTKKDELVGWARKFSLFPVSLRDGVLRDGVHGREFDALTTLIASARHCRDFRRASRIC